MMFYQHVASLKVTFTLFIIFSLQQFGKYVVTADIDDVSSVLEQIRVSRHMPGLSALVFKKGEIVAQAAVGYRRQGSSVSLLITDPVNIGSCSKWMTATLAGRLVDRKLLSWTTQVHEYFPNYNNFNSAFRNATLEQLLAHRAGVQQTQTFYNHHIVDFIGQQGNISQIRLWVAETVLKDEPEVKPGEFLYSNPGYTVAAVMMEHVTGQNWESLMQEYVFSPLEMTTAIIGSVYDDIIPPKAPVGHDLPPNQTIPIPRPMLDPHIYHIEKASSGPSGLIACTLHDWAKFLHAHVIAEITGYLSTDIATKLKRPYIGVEGYGLGVFVFNRTWATPGQALTHDGDAFGQNTVFWMTPGRDVIVVIYTNCRSVDGLSGQALEDTAAFLVRKYTTSTDNTTSTTISTTTGNSNSTNNTNSSTKIKLTVLIQWCLIAFLKIHKYFSSHFR